MLLVHSGYKIDTLTSLLVVVGLLVSGVGASLLFQKEVVPEEPKSDEGLGEQPVEK